MARARAALDGLSIGDAFGERFFGAPDSVEHRLAYRAPPAGPWRWTDDTHMAISIVEELDHGAAIDVGSLAARFARRHHEDMWRGYGAMARRVLGDIHDGTPWEIASRAIFGGEGSKGNGAAMRAAPVGAYFADDLGAAREEAIRSSLPTHAHPEAQAGAIAVAVAAALAASSEGVAAPEPAFFLRQVSVWVPDSLVRDRIDIAIDLLALDDVRSVASIVGNGTLVLAEDTVPLCLWCAARHLDSYEDALWTTVSALGDRDTTCAIVGGIVALSAAPTIPDAWRAAREPLGV